MFSWTPSSIITTTIKSKPVIRIDFDLAKVNESEVMALSEAVQKIVSEITSIEDVMVYANNAQIKLRVHPLEVFVHLSAHKITNPDELIAKIKERLVEWKLKNHFQHLINLTLIPEPWKIEIGI